MFLPGKKTLKMFFKTPLNFRLSVLQQIKQPFLTFRDVGEECFAIFIKKGRVALYLC